MSKANYLYIGENELLPADSVIGIFDIDHCSTSPRGREFLRKAQDDGLVLDASGALPRSFIVTTHPYHRQIVRLSPLSSRTVAARPQPWDAG